MRSTYETTCPSDIEPKVMENIHQRIVNTVLDDIPVMDEMVRAIKGLKDGKATGGNGIPEEVWKYGEPIGPTAAMDHQNIGGMPAITTLEGCRNCDVLQKETEQNVVTTEVYLFFPQPTRCLLGSY